MKKLIAAILILCMLLPCGCAVKSETYASLENYEITRNMYEYWLAYYKTTFYQTFAEYGLTSAENYTEDFWNTEISDGLTVGQMARNHVDSLVKEFLVCMKLFDEYKLVSTSAEKKEFKASIDAYIDDDITALGSRAALNSMLSVYGLNISTIYRLYEIEAKSLLVEAYLYGDTGTEKATDDDREAYYQENYSRVKHILIDTNKKYVLDDDGNLIMDTYTGYYQTVDLTDEEKAAKLELAQSIFQSAKDGADFDGLIGEYNEDGGMTTYTDGYFLTSTSSFDDAFLSASLDMTVNEVRLVESAYGLHVIKKYPLEKGLWSKEVSATFFTNLDSEVKKMLKEKKYSAYYSQISYDSAYSASVDIKSFSLMPEDYVNAGQ